MNYRDKHAETMSHSQLQELQLSYLRSLVDRASKSPYYKEKFEELGISTDLIESLDDIQKLPITSKEDLRSGRPERFLAVDKDAVVRLHVSSGTTGVPTAVYHTAKDLDHWAELIARCLAMIGMTEKDVFQNMTGYGLFTGGLGLHYGAERLGAMVIPSGAGNTRRQLHLMKQFNTSMIHVIPSYGLKLVEFIQENNIDPKSELCLKSAVIGAEPHTAEARRRIEEGLGLKAYNCYGLSEMTGPGVAFECPAQDGLHLWEDHYLVEILDPVELKPAATGGTGEVVITTLRREAMPLIRYRTRDLAHLIEEKCSCGRTHRRLSRITGRTDDMLILKGVNIFPMQIESILLAEPEVGGNYLIILDKQGPLDAMTVKVEMSDELAATGTESQNNAAKRLGRLLRDEILINPNVELLPPGGLKAAEGKAIRVVDNR